MLQESEESKERDLTNIKGKLGEKKKENGESNSYLEKGRIESQFIFLSSLPYKTKKLCP